MNLTMFVLALHDLTASTGDHLGAVLAAEPPKPGDVQLPANAQNKLSMLLGWGKALVYVACTAGFFAAAGKMALAWNRGEDAPWGRLATVAGACIIGGGVTGLVDALF